MKTMQFESAEGVCVGGPAACRGSAAEMESISSAGRRTPCAGRPSFRWLQRVSSPKAITLAVLLAVLSLLQMGCQPAKEGETTEAAPPPRVSEVPLRILFLSEVPEPELIQRQWLADSDQPIEIRSAQYDSDLATLSECDVLVFPAMLMGEMIAADAIYELPELGKSSTEEQAKMVEQSAGRLAQVKYGNAVYATPLGCSLTMVLGNASLKSALGEQKEAYAWDDMLAAIEVEETADFTDVDFDDSALVDRFLAIVSALTERTATYGILFEMQTMQPRLTEPEFVRAAEILKALALQPGGAAAAVGSHSLAWQWAGQGSDPRVAISIVNQINDEARETVEGEIITIQSATSTGCWNTGHGLVASVSTNCRQSAQATAFLTWLASPNTRTSMANTMLGVDAPGGLGATDGLAWRATQLIPELVIKEVPHEPSLPGALDYRNCVAEGLVRMLKNDIDPRVVLDEVSQQWQKITEEQGNGQRTQYEKSLGLGF